VRSGSHIEVNIRLRNLEFLEEEAAQLIVLVLTRMDDPAAADPIKLSDQRRQLHELRARADDRRDPHRS